MTKRMAPDDAMAGSCLNAAQSLDVQLAFASTWETPVY